MASCEGMASHPSSSPEGQGAQPQWRSHPPNHIFVGTKKPAMSYASFALLQLTQFDEVLIRARGAAISRAVDVAQIVTKRLGKDLFEVRSVRTGTEVVGEGREARNVSMIEIVMGKGRESRTST